MKCAERRAALAMMCLAAVACETDWTVKPRNLDGVEGPSGRFTPPGSGPEGAGSSSASGGISTADPARRSLVVVGTVVGPEGEPLAGARVEIGTTSTLADDEGRYVLRVGAAQDRLVQRVTKQGYFEQLKGFHIGVQSRSIRLRTRMLRRERLGAIPADTGGRIGTNTVAVAVPPQGFRRAGSGGAGAEAIQGGTVEIFAGYVDPTDPDFASMMPGGDFRAVGSEDPLANRGGQPPGDGTNDSRSKADAGSGDSGGTDSPQVPGGADQGVMTSLGAVVLEAATPDGTPADVTGGAEVCIAVPSGLSVTPPSAMPIWVLGTSTATWEQTTLAVLVDNQYCFQVESLGTYNCDVFSRVAFVEGRICTDGDPNVPLDAAELSLFDPELGSAQLRLFSNENGEFSAAVSSRTPLRLDVQEDDETADICALCPGAIKKLSLGCATDAAEAPEEEEGVCCSAESAFDRVRQIPSCTDTQVAGGDAPETRRVQIGRTQGTFDFSWEFYSIMDRIRVSYEGVLLHDTGCRSGSGSVNLSYSGQASEVVVEVIPNCDGSSSGTAWEFNVSCSRLDVPDLRL